VGEAATGMTRRDVLIVLTLVGVLTLAGEGVTRTFFSVYLDAALHTPTATIGTLSAVGQLLGVPAALATPLLMARWGLGRTFLRSAWGMVLSLLPLALVAHWASAGLGFMAMIATASIAYPAITLCQMEMVAPRARSAMSGAVIMATGLSWGLMALGGGYAIAALGYRTFFLSGAAVTAAGALLFWLYLRTEPRRSIAG
jgi:predicted MFS family arabinose efflux permease